MSMRTALRLPLELDADGAEEDRSAPMRSCTPSVARAETFLTGHGELRDDGVANIAPTANWATPRCGASERIGERLRRVRTPVRRSALLRYPLRRRTRIIQPEDAGC